MTNISLKCKRITTLIAGESTLLGLDEGRFVYCKNVKVNYIPSFIMHHKQNYIKPLLRKCCDNIILVPTAASMGLHARCSMHCLC